MHASNRAGHCCLCERAQKRIESKKERARASELAGERDRERQRERQRERELGMYASDYLKRSHLALGLESTATS